MIDNTTLRMQHATRHEETLFRAAGRARGQPGVPGAPVPGTAGLRTPTGPWFSGRGCRSLSCLMLPGWKISAARSAGRAEMGSTADTEVRLRRILLLAPGTLHVGPPASPAGPDLAENSSAKRV